MGHNNMGYNNMGLMAQQGASLEYIFYLFVNTKYAESFAVLHGKVKIIDWSIQLAFFIEQVSICTVMKILH